METTRVAPENRGEPITWDRYTLLNLAAYISIVAGYLLGVLAAQQPLTLPDFLLFTGGNLLWLWMFRRIETCAEPDDMPMRYAIGLIAVTCGVLATTYIGIQFDWLLSIVTVGIVGTLYPTRRALPLAVVMWLLTMLVLLALNWPLSISHNSAVFLQSLITLAPAFIFCMGFSFVLRREVAERARSEALVEQLEAAHAQLRAHADEVEELAAARERNRIAREIHDTLGHYLTILAVQLETALKLDERGDGQLHGELSEARRVAAECLAEVRRSVAALRPADPTAVSFSAALDGLAREFEAAQPETDIPLDIEGPAQALPAEYRLALYRCVQEALTNIRKHAHATKVLVRLRVDETAAELAVLDNGTGADSSTDSHEPGFGLLGMRERIALLGGTASARAQPGRGWRVDVRIPLRDRGASEHVLIGAGAPAARQELDANEL